MVIEALPRHTRVAMLDGIERDEIIAGAYSNREGVCPMLAAHRAGGRTTAIAFAKAWDRFAFRASRSRRPRRATARELLLLKIYLQASLLATPNEARTPVTPARTPVTPARSRRRAPPLHRRGHRAHEHRHRRRLPTPRPRRGRATRTAATSSRVVPACPGAGSCGATTTTSG